MANKFPSTVRFRRSSQILDQAVELAGAPATNFYELAKALADVKNLPLAGMASIAERTGLRIRRLYYLSDVGWMLRCYRIGKVQAERIGWTRLSIVADHVAKAEQAPDRKIILEILAKAEQHKVYDLKRVLRGEEISDHDRAAVFYLSLRQRAVLEKALLSYGATKKGQGITGKEKALIRALNAALTAKAGQS